MDAWPDGTVATRYEFRHALYRETVYGQLPAGRRAQLHRRIGARLEAGYGPLARQMATELAEHFVRGRDTPRAIQYLRAAGDIALQRGAHQEAVTHLSTARQLLRTQPATPERTQCELDVLTALGAALMVVKGQAAAEAEEAYTRARAIGQELGASARLFPVLVGLRRLSSARADLSATHTPGLQMLDVAHTANNPGMAVEAHLALGMSAFFSGQFSLARSRRAWSYEQRRAWAGYGSSRGSTRAPVNC